MKEFGLILVELKNPTQTDDFYGAKIYNDFFIKMKGDYFVPVTYLLDSLLDKITVNTDKDSIMTITQTIMKISNYLTQKVNDYYHNKNYTTVSRIITPRTTPLTGLLLKILNIIDKSNIPYEQKQLYNTKISNKPCNCCVNVDNIAFTMKGVIEYLSTSRLHPDMMKVLKFNLELLKKGLEALKRQSQTNNWLITVGVPELNSTRQFYNLFKADLTKTPLYSSTSQNIISSEYYIGVINGNGAVYYKPPLSNYIIKGVFTIHDSKKANVYTPETVFRMYNEFEEYKNDTIEFKYGNSVDDVIAVNPESREVFINTYEGFIIKTPLSAFKCYEKLCTIKSNSGKIRLKGLSPLTTISNTVPILKQYKNCARLIMKI